MSGPPSEPGGTPRAPRQREQDPAGAMPDPDEAITEALTLPAATSAARDTTGGADAVHPLGTAGAARDTAGAARDIAGAGGDEGTPDRGELVPTRLPEAGLPETGLPEAGRSEAGRSEAGRSDSDSGGSGTGGPSPAHRRPPEAARRRVWMKVAAVALCALLGVSLAAQLRRNERNGALPGARQEDLVRILDDLDNREQRLRAEINELQDRRRSLSSAAEGSQTVQEDLERRAQELGILAGTTPAEGQGLALTFRERTSPVTADLILDAVEELRGAGAEAMQISGRTGSPVRIVASTAFLDVENGALLVGNRTLTGPYTLLAIGEPETMRAALAIPGGVEDRVGDAGGTVLIDAPDRVSVSATLSPSTQRYAEPVD